MKSKKNYENPTSYKMSRIVGRNNGIEKAVRIRLRLKGVRGYRIDDRGILGSPDICFRGLRLAIFIDGDFWHGFEWDKNRSNITSANKDFWIEKIERNMERDRIVDRSLRASGWVVLRIWEHEVRDDIDSCVDRICDAISMRRLEMSFTSL